MDSSLLGSADLDKIELVGLASSGERSLEILRESWGVAWSRYLDVEDRADLLALFRALPSGEAARCHMPAFALVIGTPPNTTTVSICFKCNNIFIGDAHMEEFEADSPQARELLAFLRARMPAEGWSSEE